MTVSCRRWFVRSLLVAALGPLGVARADMFCGGGEPPEPPPSSSADAGTQDASADGPTGSLQRPCSSKGSRRGASPADFGIVAGMLLLGGGAAGASRQKPKA